MNMASDHFSRGIAGLPEACASELLELADEVSNV
jgi:hypothetical protein